MALTKVSRGLLSTSIVDNGNATAITIDSSENVMVGTDSGDAFNAHSKLRMQNNDHAYLQIKANSAKQAGILLGDTDDDFVGGMIYDNSDNSLQFTSSNSERMRILPTGGIRLTGTAPSAEDNISTINFFNTSSSTNLASITGKRTAGGTNYGSLTFNTTSSGSSSEAMRIDSSQNLYVGGKDAAYFGTKLITGSYSATSAGLSILTSSSSTGYLLFGDGAGTSGYSGQINYNHASNRMGFNTNNVESLAIDSSGSLYLLNQMIGGFGARATSGTADWNHSTNARSGMGHTLLLGTATNGPGASGFFHPVTFEYNSKDGTGNMTQLAIGYTSNRIFMRYRYSNSWASWTEK
jgi:hypothetical protein